MIETLQTPSPDILAFEAVGTVTRDDYTEVIVPALETAYQEGRKVRFLYFFGKRFSGFSPAAAWEDFKVGVQYLRLFERCAVVSDAGWIRILSSFFGSLIPCPVRTFTDDELRSAMSWLNSGAIGLNHHLDAEKGVLSVEITAPLTSENFEILAHTVDPWLEKGNQLNGIVIHVKNFPGWENLGSLIRHLQFVKNHHKKVRRVAFAADGVMANIIPLLASHLVQAEIKHFGFEEREKAAMWAAERTSSS